MEATIQQINNSTNVSINIDVLKSITKDALLSTKQRVLEAIRQHCNVCAQALPRLYRQQLRMVQAAVNGIERHPVITDAALWLMGIAIVVEAFLCA